MVENAFKYGVSQKDKTSIVFVLNVSDSRISFTAENFVKNKDDVYSSKLGLSNLEERLQIKYSDSYELNISPNGEKYIATLILSG